MKTSDILHVFRSSLRSQQLISLFQLSRQFPSLSPLQIQELLYSQYIFDRLQYDILCSVTIEKENVLSFQFAKLSSLVKGPSDFSNLRHSLTLGSNVKQFKMTAIFHSSLPIEAVIEKITMLPKKASSYKIQKKSQIPQFPNIQVLKLSFSQESEPEVFKKPSKQDKFKTEDGLPQKKDSRVQALGKKGKTVPQNTNNQKSMLQYTAESHRPAPEENKSQKTQQKHKKMSEPTSKKSIQSYFEHKPKDNSSKIQENLAKTDNKMQIQGVQLTNGEGSGKKSSKTKMVIESEEDDDAFFQQMQKVPKAKSSPVQPIEIVADKERTAQ